MTKWKKCMIGYAVFASVPIIDTPHIFSLKLVHYSCAVFARGKNY